MYDDYLKHAIDFIEYARGLDEKLYDESIVVIEELEELQKYFEKEA